MAGLISTFSNLADGFISDTFAEFAQDVIVESVDSVSDSQGGFVDTWVSFASVKAFVFPMAGKEIEGSGRIFTDQFYKVSLQPVNGITTKMRLTYDARNVEGLNKIVNFNIRSIKNIAVAGVWMELVVEMGAAQ